MNSKRILQVEQRDDVLHVILGGLFSAEAAALLMVVLKRSYKGERKIFIHTSEVTDVDQGVEYAFDNLLRLSYLPVEKICLLGEKGAFIGRDSVKVFVDKGNYGFCASADH